MSPPRPLRVLVADDEADTVTTLMLLLSEEGHEVRGVHRGCEVLGAVREFDPDAVLLDIALPDLSGWEIAKRIRETCGGERPLIIAITGRYKRRADKALARLTGFNHFLVKPFDPQAVIALISAASHPQAT